MGPALETLLTTADRAWAERLGRVYREAFRRLEQRPPLPPGA
jgi:hypothetical protein